MTNDERILNLSATVRNLANLCRKLQEENENLKMQIDDYTTELEIAESNIDELDNECATLRGELQRICTERDRLMKDVENLKTERDFLFWKVGGDKK